MLQAQVIKTVNITAGGLSSVISREEKNAATHLTVTGTIDARDFRIMRDSLPKLISIDLSGARIVPYASKKYDGTNLCYSIDWNTGRFSDSLVFNCNGGYNFAIDEVPIFALRGNRGCSSVILPSSVSVINDEAFKYCNALSSVTIPENITRIGSGTFSECSSLKTIIVRAAIPADLNKKTDVFKGVNQNLCSLFVPVGSKGKYETAAGWKDFKTIVETK